MKISRLVCACSVGALLLLAQKVTAEQIPYTDKTRVTAGQAVYEQNCAACHGKNLEGQFNWQKRNSDGYLPAPPHDETGHTWHHSDKYLFMITKYGIEDFIGQKYPNNMPAYKDILTDNEVIAVLSYIKSTWPNKVKKIHDQINDRENKKN